MKTANNMGKGNVNSCYITLKSGGNCDSMIWILILGNKYFYRKNIKIGIQLEDI